MNKIKKTGYEWCLEANIRLLNVHQWPEYFDGSAERCYFEQPYDKDEFLKLVVECEVKSNSQPRKTEKYLTYRMYGMVPYNISPIQQGIQFGHAVVDYGRTVTCVEPYNTIYKKWADKDKTFIILNGGTTNNNTERLGTLNKHVLALDDAGIMSQSFHEPDLGDQLTAVCFLVDERVFDKTTYPDFIPETLPWGKKKPSEKQLLQLEEKNSANHTHWVEKIGGPRNAFLREYLKPLRLA